MNNPLISVIVCTYNGELFLEEQIKSIASQTYPHLEIIISDDNSTDRTKAILSSYNNHPNFRLVYNSKNLGFVKNFEQAARLATGECIAFSDQDDIWLPEKIQKLYHSIAGYSMVYSDSMLIDEQGRSLNKKLSDFRKLKNNITDSKGFTFLNVVSGHTMMIKKELIQYALPLPDDFYHDWWFAVQAANVNGIIFLNEPLTLYRQHRSTVTKTIIEQKSGSRKRAERHQAFLKDLEWLKLLKENKIEKNKAFYEELYNLFLLKKESTFVWPLFYFLLKNERTLFQFSGKNVISKLVFIRKMARGEKPG